MGEKLKSLCLHINRVHYIDAFLESNFNWVDCNYLHPRRFGSRLIFSFATGLDNFSLCGASGAHYYSSTIKCCCMCGWLCLHAFRCNISRRSCGYKKDIKIETAIKAERKRQNIKDTPPCVVPAPMHQPLSVAIN